MHGKASFPDSASYTDNFLTMFSNYFPDFKKGFIPSINRGKVRKIPLISVS
jgi:hypothetical protein